MELTEILMTLIISIVISTIFYFGFGRRGPYGAFWVFILLLFLAGLAGKLWIIPTGLVMMGYTWLPLLIWIFTIAILIAAASPSREAGVKASSDQVQETSSIDSIMSEIDRRVANKKVTIRGAIAAFGIFFWIFLFLLLIAILTGSLVL